MKSHNFYESNLLRDKQINELNAFALANPNMDAIISCGLFEELARKESLTFCGDMGKDTVALTPAAAIIVAKMAALSLSLQSITLLLTKFSEESTTFARELSQSKSIHTITFMTLAVAEQDKEHSISFAKELAQAESINTIVFTYCVLDKNIVSMFKELAQSESICTAYFAHNLNQIQIEKNEAVVEIAKELAHFKALHTVSLLYQNFSEHGIAVAKELDQSKTIKTIEMVSCNVGKHGQALVEELIQSGTISKIDLAHNFRNCPDEKNIVSQRVEEHNQYLTAVDSAVMEMLPVGSLVGLVGDYIALHIDITF
jgi:hypothetical protein